MNQPEQAFRNSIGRTMQTKWLAHALKSWLEKDPSDSRPYSPDELYVVSQQAIDECSPEATHKTLLTTAKRLWNEREEQSDYETMGNDFRDWLNNNGESLDAQPGMVHIVAAALADVCKAMPSAPADTKLTAIKGLWSAYKDRAQANPPA